MILDGRFVKPRYDSGGFAGTPKRVRGHFASGKYDAVILFFVDGLGWRFIERFQDAPFIKRLTRDGTLEKLTSQFPSTTAAHVTAIHTGLPVGESGVHEWFYYEPLLDRVIAPLLFSFAGDKERDTLKSLVDSKKLYPNKTIYQALKKFGVDSHTFGIRDYTPLHVFQCGHGRRDAGRIQDAVRSARQPGAAVGETDPPRLRSSLLR